MLSRPALLRAFSRIFIAISVVIDHRITKIWLLKGTAKVCEVYGFAKSLGIYSTWDRYLTNHLTTS